jgi:hypothetical protein
MAVDITALYCCLDDFCKVFEDWVRIPVDRDHRFRLIVIIQSVRC